MWRGKGQKGLKEHVVLGWMLISCLGRHEWKSKPKGRWDGMMICKYLVRTRL